jgi:hypothetical protein
MRKRWLCPTSQPGVETAIALQNSVAKPRFTAHVSGKRKFLTEG